MTDIHTPEFDQAIAESRGGAFQAAVQSYLDSALVDIRRDLQAGLSPLEFDRARKIESALLRAGDVLRFSIPHHH